MKPSGRLLYSIFPCDSAYGAVLIRGSAVVRTFLHEPDRVDLQRRMEELGAEPAGSNRLAAKAACQLQEYFSGKRKQFELPVDLSDAPEFHRRVYKALIKVPYGKTVTYGELAKRAGSPGGARAVGQAMAHNPVGPIVPCHRVLSAGGKLGGFSAIGGVAQKRRMLRMEGVLI